MEKFVNFSFYPYTEILFGKNTEEKVGKMIRKYNGSRVLIVYGGSSAKKSGLLNKVIKTLKDEGLYFAEFGGVKPNPPRSMIENGIKIAQDEKIDFLLGIGGGSAIDTAKAIALALANDGEYWKFYKGVQAEKMIPVGTIHTISAAGTETSRSSVIVDDLDTGQKQGLNWDCCRPVFAIMNPELTYSVSAYQTGAGAADTIAHVVRHYFTRDIPSSSLGDEFGEAVARTVVKYAKTAIDKPNDYEARAELMLAASFAHNDLVNIGRSGPKGGEHVLEHQLSGHYDTTHGAGLAAIIPAWFQYIVDNGENEHIARVARFVTEVFGTPNTGTPREMANAGIEAYRAWVRSIGMPLTLKELGIPKEELPMIIKRTVDVSNGKFEGFIDLDEKVITDIYTSMAG